MSGTKKILAHIGVWKASVFAAILYGVIGIFLMPIFFLAMLMSPEKEGKIFGAFFSFMLPFLYAFMGFVMTAAACAIYNLLSRMMGGLEVTVTDPPAPQSIPTAQSPFVDPQAYTTGS